MAQKRATATRKTVTAKAPSSRAAATPKRSTTKAAIRKPVAAAKPKALRPAKPPKATKATKPAAKSENIELSKRQLLDRIVTESGMKKGDARTALDAVLAGLRNALADGHDISAAPLGKVRLVRKKDTPNGELAVLRVKLKDPKKMAANKAVNQAVAEGSEPG